MSPTWLLEVQTLTPREELEKQILSRWPSGFVDVSIARKPGAIICELGWDAPGTRPEWVHAVVDYLKSVASEIFYYPTYDDLVPWEQYGTAERVLGKTDIAGGDFAPWTVPQIPPTKFRLQ
jgi:hypothetical protein